MSFRSVPKSVTLNDLERRNGRYCAFLRNLAVISSFVVLLVLALSGIGFGLCLDLHGLV